MDEHRVGEIFATGFMRCACNVGVRRGKLCSIIWLLQYSRYCSGVTVLCIYVYTVACMCVCGCMYTCMWLHAFVLI